MLSGMPTGTGFSNITLSVVDSHGNRSEITDPITIQIREGEIVRWWKIIAFTLLYLLYHFARKIVSWRRNIWCARIQKEWGLEMTIGPDGGASIRDPRPNAPGRTLWVRLAEYEQVLNGAPLQLLRHLYRSKEYKNIAWKTLSMVRVAFVFQGIVLFYYISREQFTVWAQIVALFFYLIMLVLLSRAEALSRKKAPRMAQGPGGGLPPNILDLINLLKK